MTVQIDFESILRSGPDRTVGQIVYYTMFRTVNTVNVVFLKNSEVATLLHAYALSVKNVARHVL